MSERRRKIAVYGVVVLFLIWLNGSPHARILSFPRQIIFEYGFPCTALTSQMVPSSSSPQRLIFPKGAFIDIAFALLTLLGTRVLFGINLTSPSPEKMSYPDMSDWRISLFSITLFTLILGIFLGLNVVPRQSDSIAVRGWPVPFQYIVNDKVQSISLLALVQDFLINAILIGFLFKLGRFLIRFRGVQ